MPEKLRTIVKISFLKEDGSRDTVYLTAYGKVHYRGYKSVFPDAFVKLHFKKRGSMQLQRWRQATRVRAAPI